MDQLAQMAKSKSTTVTSIMKKREEQMQDLTVAEVADQLQHAPSTIYALLRAGEFPGAYHSGSGGRTSPWRIPQSAVDKYRTLRAA